MVECAEEAERKGVNQQGEQAVDRACCTRQISQLIHKRRRKHRHEAGCDDKERRGGVEELGDARNDTAGLFAKHPQRWRPLPVGVGEVGGHFVLACVRVPRGWMANERARGRRNYTRTPNVTVSKEMHAQGKVGGTVITGPGRRIAPAPKP